jgi:hypothetical protein
MVEPRSISGSGRCIRSTQDGGVVLVFCMLCPFNPMSSCILGGMKALYVLLMPQFIWKI